MKGATVKQIACFGSEKFTLGFQLAGIRMIMEPGKDVLDQLYGLQKNKDIGIVIIEESILDGLDGHDRAEIEEKVSPVFIPVSATADAGAIRRLILKSIGIDVWKEK